MFSKRKAKALDIINIIEKNEITNNTSYNNNIDNINVLFSYYNNYKTLIIKFLDYLWKRKNTKKFLNLLKNLIW